MRDERRDGGRGAGRGSPEDIELEGGVRGQHKHVLEFRLDRGLQLQSGPAVKRIGSRRFDVNRYRDFDLDRVVDWNSSAILCAAKAKKKI